MASDIAYDYRLETVGEICESSFLEQTEENPLRNKTAERDYQVAARDGDISYSASSNRP